MDLELDEMLSLIHRLLEDGADNNDFDENALEMAMEGYRRLAEGHVKAKIGSQIRNNPKRSNMNPQGYVPSNARVSKMDQSTDTRDMNKLFETLPELRENLRSTEKAVILENNSAKKHSQKHSSSLLSSVLLASADKFSAPNYVGCEGGDVAKELTKKMPTSPQSFNKATELQAGNDCKSGNFNDSCRETFSNDLLGKPFPADSAVITRLSHLKLDREEIRKMDQNKPGGDSSDLAAPGILIAPTLTLPDIVEKVCIPGSEDLCSEIQKSNISRLKSHMANIKAENHKFSKYGQLASEEIINYSAASFDLSSSDESITSESDFSTTVTSSESLGEDEDGDGCVAGAQRDTEGALPCDNTVFVGAGATCIPWDKCEGASGPSNDPNVVS